MRLLVLRVIFAALGLVLGLAFGEEIYALGAKAGLNFTALYTGSFLIIGGVLAWYGLPIENRYIWSKFGITAKGAEPR